VSKHSALIIAVPSQPEFEKGRGTFMPKKLTIKVGTIKMSEITVKRFMTMFRLLEMMEGECAVEAVLCSCVVGASAALVLFLL